MKKETYILLVLGWTIITLIISLILSSITNSLIEWTAEKIVMICLTSFFGLLLGICMIFLFFTYFYIYIWNKTPFSHQY